MKPLRVGYFCIIPTLWLKKPVITGYFASIIFLAGLVPVDHLKGLEQAAISKRAERLKEYKEYIEDLPEKDAKGILKELAILEKIRAQK
ncbi:hypothetical protein GAE13_26690 [Bacteroides thetaiotaomicron]|nr:hypothetical protein GAE13_26690 [Bacteroides thetaiotaomicron]